MSRRDLAPVWIAGAGAALLVASLLVAGPALAFTDPPDLTVSSDDPAVEDAPTRIGGECPAGSTTGVVQGHWTDSSGPVTTLLGNEPLDGTGEFTFAFDFAGFFELWGEGGPGTMVTIELICQDAASTPLGTVSSPYQVPDFGEVLSLPASIAIDETVSGTVDCGVTAADTVEFTIGTGMLPMATVILPATPFASMPFAFATPLDYYAGFVAGDELWITADCIAGGVTASTRGATVALAATTAPPPGGGPGGAGGPGGSGGSGALPDELATTGAEGLTPLVLAASLVALGAASIAIVRRRVRRAGAAATGR